MQPRRQPSSDSSSRELTATSSESCARVRGRARPRRRARHRRVSARGPCSADVLCSGVVPFEIAGTGLFPGLVAGFEKRSGLISLLLIQDDRYAGT
jgi:hypothetical protein